MIKAGITRPFWITTLGEMPGNFIFNYFLTRIYSPVWLLIDSSYSILTRISTRVLLYSALLMGSMFINSAFCNSTSSTTTPPKLIFGVINDNYTGSLERGEKGNYLGPDDFLTLSFFLRMDSQNWGTALVYNTLTSRKFEYRYDLLLATLTRTFHYKSITVEPGLGVVWKGDFGGDDIQNWYHRGRGLPELFVPYRQGGIGAVISTMNSWQKETNIIRSGLLTSALELRLTSGIVPSRISPMIAYQTDFREQRIQLEVLLGARFYLNEVNDYSQLIRSGVFMGFNLKTRIYKEVYLDYGMTFLPVQNLENDPLYANKSHNYIPQIIVVFSWNSPWYRIYNYLEYWACNEFIQKAQ